MANFLNIQIKFDGPSPIVVGRKHRTVQQLINILKGLDAGNLSRLTTKPFLQVQSSMVQASATATCASVANADTVTIAGQALTAAQKRASGTITCATAIAGNTITVNGQVFTAVAGAATPGEATFSIDTGDNETAASIVAQVNAYQGSKVKGVVEAKASAAIVTVYSVSEGTQGNAYTLASSGATLAVSGATLANGAAASNNTFDYIGSNTLVAASMAAAINNSTTAAVKKVSATSSGAVVTVTAKAAGVGGNAITFVSSNGTRLAVTGSGFLASGSEGAVTKWFF